jgi:hypothetical protein
MTVGLEDKALGLGHGPYVYSKDKWAVRKLDPQELGHPIDLPGAKIEGITHSMLDKILNELVPDKLMALVAEFYVVVILKG